MTSATALETATGWTTLTPPIITSKASTAAAAAENTATITETSTRT
jgi:hypothetical protein